MTAEGARRVCLLCESWTSGGIESFLYNVLTHADLTGLSVDVVAAQLGRSVFTPPLEALGVEFYELSGKPNEPGRNHRAFRALLAQRRYDCLHLNAFQGLTLAYLRLAREAGVPVRIAHSHNTALRKSPARPLKLALHRWARGRYAGDATARWACSAPAADFLFGPGAAYDFIPNGIETEHFRFDGAARAQLRRELNLGDALVVGSVGRLCYQKNQSFLLDVFAALLKRRPDSVLLLAGEGEDRPALEEKARALGLGDAVIFYGATDHVERLYWAMDVFAFPSRFEGLGIAAVEAQAAGLPVVCSDHVPPEAKLTGRVRALSLDDDAGAWARALLDLAAETAERAAGADAVAAAGFGIAAVAAKIRDAWMG